MKRFLIFFLVISVVFASCRFFTETIRGNGHVKIENRSVGSFSRVDVSSNINLYITQSDTSSVRVETDENLQEFIEVTTSGDELEIRMRNNVSLSPSGKLKVYVSGPAFRKLSASGACHIYSEGKITSEEKLDIDLSGASGAVLDLNAPRIEAGLSGAGSLDLKGQTKELNIDGSGSSDINCFELMAESVKLDISGAGSARVFASVKLDVHISGAGSVEYKGNAAVSQSISGAGSIKKVD